MTTNKASAMKLKYLLCSLVCIANCNAEKITNDNPRACKSPSGDNPLTFEVLPGMGWDNLANEKRGMVINLNYSQCRTTDDGTYLIPDDVHVIPIKSSQMSVFSKVYDHWSNYESDTSGSVNAGGSFKGFGYKVAGSLSAEFQNVKKQQVENKAITTKVQAKYHRYTSKMQPDAELTPVFRARILRIADHIQHDRNMSARYESELLVRDFGTHVIGTVSAGASIVKLDHINWTISDSDTSSKRQIALYASFSHSGFYASEDASMSAKYQWSDSNYQKYMSSIADSEIRTYGGPVINPENFTLSKWIGQIGNDLVAIDRDGFTLDFIITPQTFPEIGEGIIQDISHSVQTAITTYLRHNTYTGCTEPDSPNFSIIANADDGSCQFPFSNLVFGGVYQECMVIDSSDSSPHCDDTLVKNPHTNDLSCPVGFNAALLQTGTHTFPRTENECHKCYIFFKCCTSKIYQTDVKYTTYWCYSESPQQEYRDTGFLFGGLYSIGINNMVTGSQSCPPMYSTVNIAKTVYICVSDDYVNAEKNAIPFAGFYSKETGNPLSNTSVDRKSCPKGYSSHLAYVDNEYEIMYCIHTAQIGTSDSKLPNLQVPPFVEIPREEFETSSYMISDDSKTWTKLIDPKMTEFQPAINSWTTLDSANDVEQHLKGAFKQNTKETKIMQSGNDKSTGLSNSQVAGISVASTTVFCVLVGIAVSFWRMRRSQSNGFDNLRS